MMLTSKVSQAELSLGAVSPVSDGSSDAEKSSFSGLFSSMMAGQEEGELALADHVEGAGKGEMVLNFESLPSTSTAEQVSLPVNGVVDDVVRQLDSLTSSALRGEAASNLYQQGVVGKDIKNIGKEDVLAVEQDALSAASFAADAGIEQGSLSIIDSASIADTPVLDDKVVRSSVAEGKEVSLDASNEISPPPMVLASTAMDVESERLDITLENQPARKLNKSFDLDATNVYMGESPMQDESIEWALSQDRAVMQGDALNKSGTVAFNSLNQNGPSSLNAPSTSWGTQTLEGQGAQGLGQQASSFGQSSQQGSGQSAQQQSMFFAQQGGQANQEGKQLSLEQQMAVKAMNDTITKSEGRELLGGAEIASFDRKVGLPIGLQSINVPLKHPQWGQALGQRIVFMSNNSLQQAKITLNPQSLGQIQVTLQLDKDQKMHISLAAQSGMTRESMENALPRLREMMEQAGVQVASVDIREQKQSFSDNEPHHAKHEKNSSKDSLVEEGFIEESPLATVGLTDNIVDYYA
ncbi:hypothetical protein MNBD_GAMMA04-479 [hydrothermal vent metagenome]|uniref:Flagellar hook-length control protein-like C-terminal domain-containing protein n=1 Tax=hydrothermal vent metagenome TaxID=652676 RepID=A0A3B0VP14_9ZZZZ